MPVAASRRWAAERTSASSRARVTFFSATRLAISARSSWTPQPWRALTGSTGTPAEAVGLEQAAYVVDHAGATVLGHGVDVVEHDQHHVLVRRRGA